MSLSNEYPWQKIEQARLHHSVSKAIEIVNGSPRAVEQLKLETVELGVSNAAHYVRCEQGIRSYYKKDRLPPVNAQTFPIIIAYIRGRTFVLDGAHRLAAGKIAGLAKIPAVRLTAAQSEACIRPGMQKRVSELNLDLLL